MKKFNKIVFYISFLIILLFGCFFTLKLNVNNNLICSDFISVSAKGLSGGTEYDTITNLTGTSWEFNDSLYIGAVMQTYNINFTNDSNTYTSMELNFGNLNYGFVIVYSGYWGNQAYRTIEIRGGDDATNSTLISWLQSNAIQVQTGPTQLTTPTITKDSYNILSWLAVQNAESYEIYLDNDLYDTTEDTLYTVDSLGTYQVRAIGDGTNYSNSDLSNSIVFSSSVLSTPNVSLNDNILIWSVVQNAESYEIYLDNDLYDTISTNSYIITQNGNYQVRSIGDGTFFTNSSLSSAVNVNYDYARVVFFAKDNITELLVIENWLIGKSILDFNNSFYTFDILKNLIAIDSSVDMSLNYEIIFNDNQLFMNVSFNKYYIVSSDVNIYYKLNNPFLNSSFYDTNDYIVSISNSDTIFTDLGNNLIDNISLSFIDVNYDYVFFGSSTQTSVILQNTLTLLDGFQLGNNFSIYTDSYGNKFYFNCYVSQSSLDTQYINYLYKFDLVSDSFIIPSMDYNKFVFYNESSNMYQFIQPSASTIIHYSFITIDMCYTINQKNNYFYCNNIGFSVDISNYTGNDNKLFCFIEDTNFKFYKYFYNYSELTNNFSNFEYVLLNSDLFNSYKYYKTYLYFSFESLLSTQDLSTTYNNKIDCVNSLEDLSIKFSFGNPILYYYDTTDKSNNSTGIGIIPSSSDGLYKTDFMWYDVSSYLYNFFVYITFDVNVPVLTNIVKLIYQIISIVNFIFSQILLLFGSVTNNIFLVSIFGFLLLKFISKFLF